MHKELFALLDTLQTRRGRRIAVAAPRGHAKSTIVTLAYVLWCLLYHREENILIVSGTAELAKAHLANVKQELECNPLILQNFPELKNRSGPWRKDLIQVPSSDPKKNQSQLRALGVGQQVRGMRFREHRPTLIVADDLEERTQCDSEKQRDKRDVWFKSSLLKIGTPETNVLLLGTVVHQDSIIARLFRDDTIGWDRSFYQAVEQISPRPDLWERWKELLAGHGEYKQLTGEAAAEAFFMDNREEMVRETEVLWPELYDYCAFMKMQLQEGDAAFYADMQNQPLDPDQCIFANTNLRFWDDKYATAEDLLNAFGRRGEFYGACDPSLGSKEGGGDYSAIIILFVPSGSNVKYVIVAAIKRRTPEDTNRQIAEYARRFPISRFAFEANQFQSLMLRNLEEVCAKAGVDLPIERVDNRSNKVQRIAGLQPEASLGRLVLMRRHVELVRQLREFPMGTHDDGPDALEMAFALTLKADRLRSGVYKLRGY